MLLCCRPTDRPTGVNRQELLALAIGLRSSLPSTHSLSPSVKKKEKKRENGARVGGQGGAAAPLSFRDGIKSASEAPLTVLHCCSMEI